MNLFIFFYYTFYGAGFEQQQHRRILLLLFFFVVVLWLSVMGSCRCRFGSRTKGMENYGTGQGGG